jgi:hypothetical protein
MASIFLSIYKRILIRQQAVSCLPDAFQSATKLYIFGKYSNFFLSGKAKETRRRSRVRPPYGEFQKEQTTLWDYYFL